MSRHEQRECLPQDESTAAFLGEKTYNEVVDRLVTIMGHETPKHLLQSQSSWSMRRSAGSATKVCVPPLFRYRRIVLHICSLCQRRLGHMELGLVLWFATMLVHLRSESQ